ncbi:NAD(P)/FAD-dependent oxidoreductase [Mycoplasmopsis gallopavonis]|uniref:Thioredoxin reductase n=1 Tax=Mycoplasmopsis gallopavonis TaxID=76629 RepID=A0A449AYH8_9BACT|nr:FAD-dependent oxidoreductase [Mycoplasmopsis gallopavonis]RIV16194.1 FAD-binding protein [Mycoplasmopsis gallopavonis]VEU72583.1 thioredoxin reductase [Mycoplasmopsis gallopavonis]
MQKWDLAIIGGGPAGLNAALYASRANLKVIFIEKGAPGGKLSSTSKIENWIGTETIEGWKLAMQFFEHSKNYGATYKYGEVVNIQKNGEYDFETELSTGEKILSKTVLIATGMQNKVPWFINNLEKYMHAGISFCAICDGPLYKGYPTLVLGGGNSAVEESVYLSSVASELHIVIKDQEFTAESKIVNDLLKLPNIHIYRESQIRELGGETQLEWAIIVDKNGNEKKIEIASFFPYIGMEPKAEFARNLGVLNAKGLIETDEDMQTKIPGVFAAGDIRKKDIRQIVTAASDGSIAAKKITDIINALN